MNIKLCCLYIHYTVPNGCDEWLCRIWSSTSGTFWPENIGKYSVVDPHHIDADPDPGSTFHFDADPNPDPYPTPFIFLVSVIGVIIFHYF